MHQPRDTAPDAVASPVEHYENFPVASWLCPPALRAPITAIYAFARTADDLADEGDATADERLEALAEYTRELHRIAAGQPPQGRWKPVFGPLQSAMRTHSLPVEPLADLLSAFVQDVVRTSAGMAYADRDALLDYCRRSANPVGRLLLHLYGVGDALALRRSDAICTALQLINFWQDLSVDLPRGRHYLTDADLARFHIDRASLQRQPLTPEARALVADNAHWARALMNEGAPLVHQLPGRAGWELRLVVQGGLRILDKVDALRGESLVRRPVLGVWDWMRMAARAVAM
ncbi:squalene synthase HpnC [Paracidovorax konjaci]|uniref:Squalene synthase HpnC n=1 Tax=Paracidovorax konjaci TaxID=32040 RepID=A0A1I1WZY0_9BURK|nr:squalene synthase HpnC [Paracidovorax konjaci]SFE00541.1 squalene synthase HpnC [Paracidovorax konjaci]